MAIFCSYGNMVSSKMVPNIMKLLQRTWTCTDIRYTEMEWIPKLIELEKKKLENRAYGSPVNVLMHLFVKQNRLPGRDIISYFDFTKLFCCKTGLLMHNILLLTPKAIENIENISTVIFQFDNYANQISHFRCFFMAASDNDFIICKALKASCQCQVLFVRI